MRAIKCDRCGKTYIPEYMTEHCFSPSGQEVDISPVYSVDVFITDAKRNMQGIYNLSAKELCDECYNSILYFLINPNTVVVSNNDFYNKPQEV